MSYPGQPTRARSTLLALLLCTSSASFGSGLLGAQEAPEPGTATTKQRTGVGSQKADDPVFQRRPQDLPRSAPGRWLPLYDADKQELLPSALVGLQQDALNSLSEAGRAYQQRDYPACLRACYSALELEPDLPPALAVLGITYFRLKRYGDCITVYERQLAAAPAELWRSQALAHSYYSIGRYEDALAHYAKVIAAVPVGQVASLEARRGLALAHMRLGDADQALEQLRAVLADDPTHAESQTWVAQILFDRGDSALALPEARRATELDPYEPRPWYLLSQILTELGQESEAQGARERWQLLDRVLQGIRSVEAELAYQPGDYARCLRLVELQGLIGNQSGLRAAMDRALRSKPASVSMLDFCDFALRSFREAGDTDAARGAAITLERTLDSSPPDPLRWKVLEQFWAEVGDRERQIHAGEKARRLGG